MLARRWLRRFADLVLPPCCGICALPTGGSVVCDGCRADLPWTDSASFGIGGTGTPTRIDGDRCLDPVPVTRVFSPLHYRFPVDAMIKTLKFRHQMWIAPVLADLLLPTVIRVGDAADGVVPVPLHRWRHARRGFNQAEEIARVLARRSGLPLARALTRVRATRPQSDLDGDARRRNVAGSFRARKRLRIRHPLLIDDVITTGETCRAAATALLDAGAEQVTILAVARASQHPS